MKTLIVEDDFVCRRLMQEYLKDLGPVDIAVNGKEAVEAVRMSLDEGCPYTLICLDVMMPGMDGQEALTRIRAQEVEHDLNSSQGATILMTTALDDPQNVIAAYKNLCDGYLVKPISKTALFDELRKHKLLVF